jgi:putative transposase
MPTDGLLTNEYALTFTGSLSEQATLTIEGITLSYARAVIQQWRTDYNEQRPHSMLGYRTPAEAAGQLRS